MSTTQRAGTGKQTYEKPSEWLVRVSSEFKKYNDYKPEDHDFMYRRELTELAEKYGRDATENGVMLCVRDGSRENRNFRPMPEDLESYVKKMVQSSVTYKEAESDCRFCEGTGWAPAKQDGYVTKCKCRVSGAR